MQRKPLNLWRPPCTFTVTQLRNAEARATLVAWWQNLRVGNHRTAEECRAAFFRALRSSPAFHRLALRYGLDGEGRRSERDIAMEEGVSRKAVRESLEEAIALLPEDIRERLDQPSDFANPRQGKHVHRDLGVTFKFHTRKLVRR